MSKSACPIITKKGEEQLNQFTQALVTSGINLKSIGNNLATCPTKGGKRKGGKRKGMKIQRGGALTIQQVKHVYMFLLAIVAGFVLTGDTLASRSIWDGVQGIYNGECSTFQNRIFSQWGFGNPFCTVYITILDHAVKALGGQALSLGFMGMVVSTIIAAPMQANRIIDGTVNTFATIVNKSYPGTIIEHQHMIENGNGGKANTMALENEMNEVLNELPPDAQAVFVPQTGIEAVIAATELVPPQSGLDLLANMTTSSSRVTELDGGKRKSKRKMKTKKSKKSNKSKKSKKSKKVKKTKKSRKA